MDITLSKQDKLRNLLNHKITLSSVAFGAIAAVAAFGPRDKAVSQSALENHVSPAISVSVGHPIEVSFGSLCKPRSEEPKNLIGKYISIKGDRVASFAGSTQNSNNQSIYAYDLSGQDWALGNINTGPGWGTIAIVSPKPLPDNCIGVQGIWKEDKGIRFVVPRELILKEVVVPFNN